MEAAPLFRNVPGTGNSGELFMRIFLMLLVFSFSLIGQQVDRRQVKSSGDYYFGSGIATTANEARDKALKELTSQIAVRVASSFQQKVQETGKGIQEDVESILRTHTRATLRNVQSESTPRSDGQIEVFCYLPKKEVAKIFEERGRLVADMAGRAKGYRENGNIAFALKLYYYSLLLINSLPDESLIIGGVNYTTMIPQEISQIMLAIRYEFQESSKISDREREVTLYITHNRKPVALLDFTFWDGSDQIAVQARDGYATFRLLGSSVDFNELKVAAKYAYYESREEYTVVADLWDLVNRPVFQCQQQIKLKRTAPVAAARPAGAGQNSAQQTNDRSDAPAKNTGWDLRLQYDEDIPVATKILDEARTVLFLLDAGDGNKLSRRYAGDRYLQKKLSEYMKFNRPKVLQKSVDAKVNRTRSGYEMRRVRVLHQYPTLKRQSTEFIVLDFDEKGILQDINLCITDNLYQKFVQEAQYGNDWANRQEIIKFVEKYRTAYMTRDIKTVELMFAEDALIIVGREIKPTAVPRDLVRYQKFGNQPEYQYVQLSKGEYIQRQRQVFRAQQDIFLDFASFNMIKKNSAPQVYGIEMRQSYFSTTYADEGYLFLLIDFSEKDPLIYVRAWQPNEWNEEQLIKTANFKIYK